MITVFEFIPNLADAGAESVVRDYCLYTDKNKVRIYPIVLWDDVESANIRCLIKNNIPIFSVYKRQNIFTRVLNKLFGKIYVPHKINQIMKKYDSRVLHIHLQLLGYTERLSKINKDIYFFYTCHNIPQYYFDKNDIHKKLQMEHIQRLLSEKRVTIVALHDQMKTELQTLFDTTDVVVFRNGIDTKHFCECSVDSNKKREALNIPRDAFVVGHIGRFSSQKNHLFLLDIFCELKKKNANAFLLMVGEGELRDEIVRKLNQNGLNGSYLILEKRSDVNELLKVMDCFLFPSLFEGLGIVVIEAQTSGLPCIVSSMIPADAVISDMTCVMDLKESAEKWADGVDNAFSINKNPRIDLEKYEIQTVMEYVNSCYIRKHSNFGGKQ